MALICFDVDGTLLDNEKKDVHPITIETLHALRKKHKLAIATGRSYASVKATGILDAVSWDAFILNNGQLVFDHQKNLIKVHYLDSDEFFKLYQLCMEKGLNCSIATKDDWYLIKEADAETLQAHDYFNEWLPHVGTYHDENVVMASIYAPIGYDYTIFRQLKKLNILPTATTSADVCAFGCSKYYGILKLMAYLQEDHYIAFGDSENDLEMIEHAAIGIVMGQADDFLKSRADYVTKSCHQNGVSFACEQLRLFEENCIEKFKNS